MDKQEHNKAVTVGSAMSKIRNHGMDDSGTKSVSMDNKTGELSEVKQFNAGY
jgi:hypothetical protein